MEVLAIVAICVGIGWFLLWIGSRVDMSPTREPSRPAPIPIDEPMPTEFVTRLSHTQSDEAGTDPARMIDIAAMGPFPVQRPTQAAFVISVLDDTDSEPAPVLSPVAAMQEPETIAYQNSVDAGLLLPGQGINNWARIDAIPPWLLQPPKSGHRKLLVVIRMIDLSNPPPIRLGFCPSHDGLLWVGLHPFYHAFFDKGWVEAGAHRREAKALTLQIGVALAMVDGSLHEAEGQELQRWATKAIDHLNGEEREREKERLNSAIKEAFSSARSGRLHLDDLIPRLGHIGDTAAKYEVLDFCFDLMAADKQATPSEMSMLTKVAKGLDLDMAEFHALRDKKLVGLAIADGTAESAHHLLGIDPSWDRQRVLTHLKGEFRKWNDRLNVLGTSAERENAQRLLDAVAAVRKRYE